MADVTTSDLSHLASALDSLATALWLSAESNYDQIATLTTQQEKIMAAVQLDDSVIATTVTDIEGLVSSNNALVTAVTTFLSSSAAQAIPQAQLDALNGALADADAAAQNAANTVTALNNATPPASS